MKILFVVWSDQTIFLKRIEIWRRKTSSIVNGYNLAKLYYQRHQPNVRGDGSIKKWYAKCEISMI
jgi:hypothetical protein